MTRTAKATVAVLIAAALAGMFLVTRVQADDRPVAPIDLAPTSTSAPESSPDDADDDPDGADDDGTGTVSPPTVVTPTPPPTATTTVPPAPAPAPAPTPSPAPAPAPAPALRRRPATMMPMMGAMTPTMDRMTTRATTDP